MNDTFTPQAVRTFCKASQFEDGNEGFELPMLVPGPDGRVYILIEVMLSRNYDLCLTWGDDHRGAYGRVVLAVRNLHD